jgi:hypothetical protein
LPCHVLEGFLAPHPQEGLVGVEDAVVQAEHVDQVGGAGEDRLVEPLLPLRLGGHPRQVLLGLPPFGEVDPLEEDSRHGTAPVPKGLVDELEAAFLEFLPGGSLEPDGHLLGVVGFSRPIDLVQDLGESLLLQFREGVANGLCR